jgi:hypothetical protein
MTLSASVFDHSPHKNMFITADSALVMFASNLKAKVRNTPTGFYTAPARNP